MCVMRERSLSQIRTDIFSGRYDDRKMSNNLAPEGYKFQCNLRIDNENPETRTDFRTIEWYLTNGYKIISRAFNMYDEPLDEYVAVYRKRDQ